MKCKIKISLLLLLGFVLAVFLYSEYRESSNHALLEKLIIENNIDRSIFDSEDRSAAVAPWEEDGIKHVQSENSVNEILKEVPSFNQPGDLTVEEEYRNIPVLSADVFASFIKEKNEIKKTLLKKIEEDNSADFLTYKMAERLKSLTVKFSFNSKEKEESRVLFNRSTFYKITSEIADTEPALQSQPAGDSKIILSHVISAVLPVNNFNDNNENFESKYLHSLKDFSNISHNVNLNEYSLETGKVDVFKTLLYIWEDNPYLYGEVKTSFLFISSSRRIFFFSKQFSFDNNDNKPSFIYRNDSMEISFTGYSYALLQEWRGKFTEA